MTAPAPVVRPLTAEDTDAAYRLREEAFGVRPGSVPPDPFPAPGSSMFGTFAGDQLLTRLGDLHHTCFVGDQLVPMAGISGVTVAAEARGRGLLTELLRTALTAAHERGAVLSGLHPSAPAIYRRFGYEVVTDYVDATLPTASLSRIRPGDGVTTRRAGVEDVAAVRDVYEAWARGHIGPLTRTGPCFPDQEQWVRATDAVTLAEQDGRVCGYVAWNRGSSTGGDATLEVADLYATSAAAYRTLLHTLGQFAMVTPTVAFTSSGNDPLRLLLPASDWKVTYRSPYMMRILDVERALTGLPSTDAAGDEMVFSVTDDLLPRVAGSYALRRSGAETHCVRIERTTEGPVFTARGLAACYTGAHTCATLRATGLLSGSATDDAGWDLVSGGRSGHIRDYF